MIKLSAFLIGACAAAVLSGCGQPQSSAASQATPPAPAVDPAVEAAKAQQAREAANKKVVEDFFGEGITTDQKIAMMSPGYIQHNPAFARFAEINHIQSGPEAFKILNDSLDKLQAVSKATRGPQAPPGNNAAEVIAEGDLVAIMREIYAPDPTRKGQFYKVDAFDIFRVQDGKLTEHWSSATIPPAGPMFTLLSQPLDKVHFPKQRRKAD